MARDIWLALQLTVATGKQPVKPQDAPRPQLRLNAVRQMSTNNLAGAIIAVLTRDTIHLIGRMDHSCKNCIRSGRFAEAISGTEALFWTHCQRVFVESAIVHWCTIFGARSETTHFRKFFARPDVAQLGESFRGAYVIERICSELGMDTETYAAFHAEVTSMRDKYVVHRDGVKGLRIADYQRCADQCLIMRKELEAICIEGLKQDPGSTTLKSWVRGYSLDHSNEQILSDIGEAKKSIGTGLATGSADL